ncbi:putative allantoin permease [Coleophoma crateriformis]|uniref:Putative allantoin permease n=1 Tax=Coleophoma crateriformis TaxID=565419 RepID=A0A3D8QEK4_9HELO|nr:putative allantoin permease [Coleophoma crateriformis]
MTTVFRQRVASTKERIQEKARGKSKLSGWVLPRQTTSFADEGTWTNIDADVTPIERRTWTSSTVLGFWFSDALNAQGWEGPSSIIQLGLTWREAIYLSILGAAVDTIPLVLNGVIGAHYHIPFPVVARSAFGFYFSKFAVVTRMITALFWHAIQTWTGSTAMFQIIRAIWPSFLDIPNHLPESAGITTQQMIAHTVFWCVQFPILLTPPHKLKWFFVFKVFIVLTVSTATVIAMTYKAHGVGDIWNQNYSVSGSKRSWLILNQFSAQCGGWATMATNIPDFTRYMKKSRGVYWQALFLPLINLLMAMFGTISTSCAKVVYGTYIWSPMDLAAEWDGPWGRCGAFFVGFCWVVAQIGTNLSANVISASNDLTNLFPKYINIRRGVIIITVTAGWIMVPWKIVYSAQSLVTFMSGLAIFLAPIAAIVATDYWTVKNRNFDVPGLYRRHGRYRYRAGVNWRALVAFVISVTPNVPGLAQAVNSKVKLNSGIEHLYDMNYLWGFTSAAVLYWSLNKFFPATETLLEAPIYEDVMVLHGVEYVNDGVHDPQAKFEEKGLDMHTTTV